MQQIIYLILKDLKSDTRNKYPVFGILLYLTALIIISYLTFATIITPEIWNALFWMLLLFISVTAIARSFIQEENRSNYYYYVVSPDKIIIAKIIYFGLYQLTLSFLTWILFSLFLGNKGDQLLFFLILFLGSFGLSSSFSLISAIAAKTNNQSTLMPILGFPIIIPILILAVTSSQTIILGGDWDAIKTDIIALASLNVINIALSFILFPFIWKS